MTEEMNSLLADRSRVSRKGRPLALLFSVAVHLGMVVWLVFPVIGRADTTRTLSAPGFVHVRMVSGSPAAEEAAATVVEETAPPPEPTPEPAPRLVEKIPEKSVQKKKPKTTPSPPRPPKQTAPAPTDHTGAVSDSVGMGSGQGQGGLVGLDGLDTRFSWYLDLVVSKISGSWEEPYLDSRFGKTYRVTVYFIIHRNGSLSDVRVEESSGVDVLDLSAVRSIREASPLPPLPQDFRGDHLGVHFWFDYKRD